MAKRLSGEEKTRREMEKDPSPEARLALIDFYKERGEEEKADDERRVMRLMEYFLSGAAEAKVLPIGRTHVLQDEDSQLSIGRSRRHITLSLYQREEFFRFLLTTKTAFPTKERLLLNRARVVVAEAHKNTEERPDDDWLYYRSQRILSFLLR